MLNGTTFVSSELVRRESLKDAAVFLSDQRPKLILLDLHLPDARGLALLAHVSGMAPHVPIVVLTAQDDDELSAHAVKAGAQDYLVKGGFNTKTLARAIRHALARQQLLVDLEHARSREVQRATHDDLTGLPNRILFFDRLGQAIERSRRSVTRFAVVFVDLNGFKDVNDTDGHAAGDEILRQVAARLTSGVRASDTVARLGGDEFTVLYEGIPSREAAQRLAQGIHEKFVQPMLIDGRPHSISISAGLALYPDDGGCPETLLQFADTAMYEEKRAAKVRLRR
jgi:diguanylate cyclase (GGDEF)-like protein